MGCVGKIRFLKLVKLEIEIPSLLQQPRMPHPFLHPSPAGTNPKVEQTNIWVDKKSQNNSARGKKKVNPYLPGIFTSRKSPPIFLGLMGCMSLGPTGQYDKLIFMDSNYEFGMSDIP